MTGAHARHAVAAGKRGEAVVWQAARRFVGETAQVSAARQFIGGLLGEGCPLADDAVLVISELVSNAVLHSETRRPGGKFTVRAEVCPDRYLRVEVEDDGGPWAQRGSADERMHGLGIVSALTEAWGRDGSPATGWIVWARLRWPRI